MVLYVDTEGRQSNNLHVTAALASRELLPLEFDGGVKHDIDRDLVLPGASVIKLMKAGSVTEITNATTRRDSGAAAAHAKLPRIEGSFCKSNPNKARLRSTIESGNHRAARKEQ